MTTTHRVISYTLRLRSGQAYDSLYRLITATYSTGEYYHYTYDPVGNRLRLTTTVDVVNYQYDDANRLTSVNGQAYTWDNNGNLLSDGVRTYTYTHANRLTQVVSGTLTTEFVYNGAGDRVARTVDGVTTGYVLDGSTGLTTGPAAGLTQVLQETTDGQTTSYLYGADGSTALTTGLLAQYDSGTWAYHLNDGLGSVRQLADPAGQVVASYSFSPFGVPLGESGGEPYGFTGEQWDASAGLVFLRARFYESAMGRFVSKDPFPGFATKPHPFNAYPYTTNNPATLVDPSGYLGGGAGVFELSFKCLLSNPACQAAAAEAAAIAAVTVEIVGPIVLIAGPPLILMYFSARYGYWPEPTVQPRPAPAPPGAPPTEEPTAEPRIGRPPVGPGFSQGEAGPESPFVQPVRAPEPPPAPHPQPQMDPIAYDPCPRERETPEPRGQIWRAISIDPKWEWLNWRPSRSDYDGLSGTRGGIPPYHQDVVAWFQIAMKRMPDSTSDRVVATTEQTLFMNGFSVENTFDEKDPWHISIGRVSPGIVIDEKSHPSWPGTKSERRAIEIRLASLFTIQVWP